MPIITIASQKGGTGKTTLAAAVAHGLYNKGYSVLLADCDQQCNLTDTEAATADNTIREALTMERPRNAILRRPGRPDIIPGSKALTDKAFQGLYMLRSVLAPLKREYDFIIVDAPPRLDLATMNAIIAADVLLLPLQPDRYSLKALDDIAGMLASIERETKRKPKIMAIINRYTRRSILNRDMADNIAEAAEAKLKAATARTKIRECVAIKEAQALQRDIFSYAPRSNATADFKALTEEILNYTRE